MWKTHDKNCDFQCGWLLIAAANQPSLFPSICSCVWSSQAALKVSSQTRSGWVTCKTLLNLGDFRLPRLREQKMSSQTRKIRHQKIHLISGDKWMVTLRFLVPVRLMFTSGSGDLFFFNFKRWLSSQAGMNHKNHKT